MTYITVAIYAVPNANKDAFIAHAKALTPLFVKHGALTPLDAWGDDVPEGKVTDFRRAVQLKEDETVILSWTIWPDKATRDTAWAKMMEDDTPMEMPFDGKRMIFGGFEPLLVTE